MFHTKRLGLVTEEVKYTVVFAALAEKEKGRFKKRAFRIQRIMKDDYFELRNERGCSCHGEKIQGRTPVLALYYRGSGHTDLSLKLTLCSLATNNNENKRDFLFDSG